MRSLINWQQDFLLSIQQKDNLSPALKVYRNNTLAGLKDSLEAAYPVLLQLVGHDCFDGIVQRYQQQYWPSDTNLNHYGAQLADFLSHDPVTEAVPYLPDMARLEYAISMVSDAPDDNTLSAVNAQEAMQSHGDALRLVPHPACVVLKTEWPVSIIWRQHQEEKKHIENIEKSIFYIFIQRKNGIVVTDIEIGTYTLLTELNNGVAFTKAAASAATVHPSFDLVMTLQTALADGWFSHAEATQEG